LGAPCIAVCEKPETQEGHPEGGHF
jgi:hypothetical protein